MKMILAMAATAAAFAASACGTTEETFTRFQLEQVARQSYDAGYAQNRSVGGQQQAGFERERSSGGGSQSQSWGSTKSTGSGEKKSCSIDVHIDDEPAGWLGKEGANAFGDYLKYQICKPLMPKGVVAKIDPVAAPSWVSDASAFDGIGMKGSYETKDGKKVTWSPKKD